MSRDLAFEERFRVAYDAAKRYSATLEGPSLTERLAALPAEDREQILSGLTRTERAALAYCWALAARPKQDPPRDGHRVLLWCAGRGFGKNKSGAERVREHLRRGAKSVLLVGPTLREVMRYMVGGRDEGGSGLLDVLSPAERRCATVRQEAGEIVFAGAFADGAVVHLASDEAPELRGGSYSIVWCDEPCKWRHFSRAWANIEFSTRDRRAENEIIVTTTPKPQRWLRELVADPDTRTIIGSSDENASNLDAKFLARLERKVGGTRMGRQEQHAEILTEGEGALFSAAVLDAARVDAAPDLVRVVVSIDPAIATGRDNDATGLLAIGIDARGHIYVLDDASGKMSPEQWGAAALRLYDRHRADAFVGERNRGGDLVASNMRATIREIRGAHAVAKIVEVHASRGKAIRAEPVSTLAEQGRLHIVGEMRDLEDELTTWSPEGGGLSPNRLDALVWGVFELARLSGEEDAPAADPKVAFRGIAEFAAMATGQADITTLMRTRDRPLSATAQINRHITVTESANPYDRRIDELRREHRGRGRSIAAIIGGGSGTGGRI